MAKPINDAIASAPSRKQDERKFEHVETGNTARVHSVSDRIRTLEQALAHGEIDTTVWEVERVAINSWEAAGKVQRNGEWSFETVTLWQVKASLRRKVAKPLADAACALFDRFQKHKPLTITPPKKQKGACHLLELSLFDAHFGKLAWSAETGQDYDTRIAERIYHLAVGDLLSRSASFPVERILFAVGSDFFHVDSWINETTRGTPQDHDGRFQKVFRTGCMAVVFAIERCLAVAPVHVVWVPGNHDTSTSFYLAEFLWAWFRTNPNVTFDRSVKSRKVVEYGVNLIGLTHGDEEKLPDLASIMATEWPELWAKTTVREWHVGHWHKKKELKHVDVDEHQGVRIRVLPSLSGKDAWHFRKGYHSRRCAEAYLWHREEGYAGHLSVNAREG